MEWSDLATIVFVLVALWTFLPRRFRHAIRSGLEPAVIVMADSVRTLVRAVWPRFVELLYTVLVGQQSVMVNAGAHAAQESAAVAPVVTTSTITTAPIVTPNNEYNGELSNSEFEATARTIAVLYQAGIVTNLSKAICKAYGCSVQAASKPDSTYQRALRAVNKRLPKNGPTFNLTPEQQRLREELGLSK